MNQFTVDLTRNASNSAFFFSVPFSPAVSMVTAHIQ